MPTGVLAARADGHAVAVLCGPYTPTRSTLGSCLYKPPRWAAQQIRLLQSLTVGLWREDPGGTGLVSHTSLNFGRGWKTYQLPLGNRATHILPGLLKDPNS